ncbi:MAG TPA: RluA family pseudouridine synthase [Chitinophagaceae bacterium]|nr:RluA family pseudouridine synthase [Chitinophagaceae bacterium]
MILKNWILFEDENLIVLNKPSGLLSIPDREGKEVSLKRLLQEKFENIFTVHRLDRDTSGLIVFAKNELTHKNLSQQFETRQTEKVYLGLVHGSVSEKAGTIDAPIAENQAKKGTMIIHKNGKASLTDYEVLENFKLYSWLQFRIHTGRTHQIRVHAKHLGHPVVGDPVYGDGKPVLVSSLKSKFNLSKNELEERPLLNRLALHALNLKFTNTNGETIKLEAPLPKDLKATLQQLNKWKKPVA